MENLLFFAQSVLFCYFSYLTGFLICKLLKIKLISCIKKTVYPIILGYGALGSIGLLFALFGIYKISSFYLLAIIIILLSNKTISNHLKWIVKIRPDKIVHLIKTSFKNFVFLKIIILVWIILYFAISFTPSVMGSDGLAYHLPFTIKFINSSSISFPVMGSLSYGHLPLFTEVFYGIPIIIFKNFVTFKIIQFSALVLLLLVLMDFCRKYIKNKILLPFLAILIFSNMPLQKAALSGGFIDIFTFLFGVSSLLILTDVFINRQSNNNEKDKFLISGIFLGLALSTKYLALFFVILNYLLLILLYLSRKKSFLQVIKKTLLYTFPVILLSGFWYIKNIIYTGNPVFPMFSRADFTIAVGRFVIERKILNFFIFPFVFFGKKQIFELPYAFLNAFYFAFAYLAGIFLIIKKKISKPEIILFILLEIYLAFLFYFSHQIRFAIPALILITVLCIFILDKVIITLNDYFKRCLHKFTCFLSILFSIVSIILFIGSANAFATEISCLVGQKEMDKCLAETTGSMIYVTNYINQNLQNKTIIEYWNPFQQFSLKNGNHYSEYFCEDKILGKNIHNIDINDAIKACLADANIKYLADDTSSRRSYSLHPEINNVKHKIVITQYFIENAEIIYEFFDSSKERNSYIRLYKLE